jgi:hypothetical protein
MLSRSHIAASSWPIASYRRVPSLSSATTIVWPTLSPWPRCLPLSSESSENFANPSAPLSLRMVVDEPSFRPGFRPLTGIVVHRTRDRNRPLSTDSGAHTSISRATKTMSAQRARHQPGRKTGDHPHLHAPPRLKCAHSNNRHNRIVTSFCCVKSYGGALE